MLPRVGVAALWHIRRQRRTVRRQLHAPWSMPPTPPAQAAAERAPATRTSCVKGGDEALSQMVKTTRSPQQRRHSSTRYTPWIWRGEATLPGARRGGGPPAVWAERERALWPTPTAVRQQLYFWKQIMFSRVRSSEVLEKPEEKIFLSIYISQYKRLPNLSLWLKVW
jgi:hypothetical protein